MVIPKPNNTPLVINNCKELSELFQDKNNKIVVINT